MATVLPHVPTMGIYVRAIRVLDRISAGVAERRRRAAVLRELRQCDERDLRDLGISRYDFEAIARGSFKR